jgi:hypothetical protein
MTLEEMAQDLDARERKTLAYIDGYNTGRIGLGFLDNPYRYDTWNYSRWIAGWEEGFENFRNRRLISVN